MFKKLLIILFLNIGIAPQMLAMKAPEIKLTQEKDDVNCQDNRGETQLMIAAKQIAPEMCQTLLAQGALPFLQNIDGSTALHLAAYNGKTYGYNTQSYSQRAERRANKKIALGASTICKLIIDHQKLRNDRIVTALLCLCRLKKNGNQATSLLYRYRDKLLFPYLADEIKRYYPIHKLLRLRNAQNNTAYEDAIKAWRGDLDCLALMECLNPMIYDHSAKDSKCSIQ